MRDYSVFLPPNIPPPNIPPRSQYSFIHGSIFPPLLSLLFLELQPFFLPAIPSLPSNISMSVFVLFLLRIVFPQLPCQHTQTSL